MTPRSYVLALQARGVVTIPADLRKQLHADQPGAQIQLVEVRKGVYEMSATVSVPAEDAWFWSERWQRMEREAQADIDAGRIKSFATVDDFVADLNS
jgi:antitoxin MazE